MRMIEKEKYIGDWKTVVWTGKEWVDNNVIWDVEKTKLNKDFITGLKKFWKQRYGL